MADVGVLEELVDSAVVGAVDEVGVGDGMGNLVPINNGSNNGYNNGQRTKGTNNDGEKQMEW